MARFVTIKDPQTFFDGWHEYDFNGNGTYEDLCRMAWDLDGTTEYENLDDNEFKGKVWDAYCVSIGYDNSNEKR